VKSSRFDLLVPAAVLRIDDGSVLMLKYSYLRAGAGAGAVWDLGGVYLADGEQRQKWVGLLRRPKPSPSMPEELTQVWRTMTTGAHPWEGTAFVASGRTEINALINRNDVVAGKTDVGYTMSLNVEGTQPVDKMKSEFLAVEGGFKMLE